jgi:hypothetical protein
MKKNKYEISLWEDRLVLQTGEGQSIVPEHYEEEKVCIIGSDTMTSQARALEPKLVKNVNGTNKLTFKLYYTYIDNETGKRIQNPFTSLLVNERKVKCKWEDQWYDFVIKSVQEDSNGKTITYTCEDLYINELSKTGFSLEFDQKLNNNQGTAQELAKKVLDGTDWVVDTGSSDHILQTIEEPLYRAQIGEGKKLVAIDKNGNPQTFQNKEVIYLFYSVVQEKKSYIQFIYNTSYETESNSQLLKENNCYSVEMDWSTFEGLLDKNMEVVFSDYRGKRLVRKQLQEFNSALNRNCYVYKDQNNNKVLGYSIVEYKDPTVVLNLISNSKEFVDTNGWQGALSWELYPLFFGEEKLNYSYTSTTYLRNTTEKPILAFNSGLQDSAGYLEDGLQPGQRYFLRIRGYNGEPNGKSPVLNKDSEIKFHIYDYFTALSSENSIPVHNTEDYCEKIGEPQLEDYYFITSDVEKNTDKNYYIRNTKTKKYDLKTFPEGAIFPGNDSLYEKGQILQIEFKVIRARPKKEITAGYFGKHTYTDSAGNFQTENSIARPGIFISLPANSWIQEVQFYQRVEGYNGSVIHLGDFDTQSKGVTYYKYFLPNDSYKKEEDIAYLYCGTTQKTDLTEVYEDKSGDTTHVLYEKIRSITAKNSNRFNILQNIAETFQCWVRFKIEHNEDTGKIIYEKGIPKKTVYFKEEIGEDLGYGFVYGIDLKTISRSIDSNQLTTKVVVAPNTSEYAENGICRIADADLNENGENYILDFGYYISQGLLNSGELNKYLYLPDNNGNSGFYVELKNKNKEYNGIVEKLTPKKTELSKQTSLQTIYDQYVSNSVTEITTLQNNLCKLVGFDIFDDEAILEYLKTHSDNEEVKNIYSNLITQQHKRESFQASLKLIESSVNELTKVVNGYEEDLKAKVNEKKALESTFYQKFSRFIQEGSWTSQDYIDPNLYYLDARSVAYTSSRPKISYNISVIRLNALDEYKGKKFNVGDISFIEDKEFFGYIKGKDAWKTPYHEKVLISESTSWFDSPEKDTFTIQNYKTQFEDLFQRITATTQSLQYSTGEYNRASSIVEGKGVINTETLQNSININNELVFKSQNEEIFQDSTGLTLTDKRDPSKRTKLTSGGLFISTDGGVTWKNAVRGEGVATQYLTSGSINTNSIAIYDGAHASFRWDKYGINAYDATREIDEATNQEVLKGIVTNNFVRFDQYGVYGIKGATDDPYNPQKETTVDGITAVGEDKIWRDALFGMTWKGFFLKNKSADKNQQIEISTEKDICVSKIINKKVIDKIRIGQVITKDNKAAYGLQLKDDTGTITMETDDSGHLWLRDKLRISNVKYEKTKDLSFVEGKTYYKKESDGTYSIVKPSEISIEDCYELKNSGVSIGVLETGKEKNQIFNSNNNFIVYDDGSVKATKGSFSGGTIGGFTIEDNRLFSNDVVLSSRGIEIKNNGTLSILDGNTEVFSANKTFYEKTTDTTPQEGKTYYIYNKDTGVYTLWEKGESTEFPGDIEIYDAVRKTIFSGTLEGANGSFSGELKGATGIFSGELQSATGVFTGSITAQSGTIGGFTINTNNLTSVNESVILDGTNGKITAENIELGDGAEVRNRISFTGKVKIKTIDTVPITGKTYYKKAENGTFSIISNPNVDNIIDAYEDGKEGTAYLENPANYGGTVLEAGELKLKTTGLLEFGDIKISGDQTNPTIKSSLWTIDKDKAVFNNVIAQGGTIENVVFKNSTVQGAGGIMFFKPSYSGTSISSTNTETIFTVEETGLNVGDHVIVNGQEGNVTTIEQTRVTISGVKFEKDKTITIIKLYNNSLVDEKINLTDNLLIGVNSLRAEQSQGGTVGKNEDCHLFRGGLTVTLPTVVTKTIDTGETQTVVEYPNKPNLFIGDLYPITGKPGYGLYGDNVYLNGTLTTKVKSDKSPTYAGVNTIDGYNVDENLFKDKDASQKIVFWAGSIGEDKQSVQQAPFQVTDKGNLYAKAGTFTDSVFSNSKIEGSKIYGADIYTASIHGWTGTSENGDSSALNVYNTSKGIIFKEEKDYRLTTDTKIDKTKKYYQKNSDETYSIVGIPEESEISSYYEFIEKTLYQISKTGFTTPQKEFITIFDNTIDFSGDTFRVDTKKGEKEIDRILLSKDGISCFTVLDNEFSSQKSYLSFSKDRVSLKTITSGKESGIITGELSVEDSKITSNGNFFAQQNIFFGNSLEYRKVTEGKTEVGYDLYIKTSTETSVSGQ